MIIRDHNCSFIHAIAAPLGEGTKTYAETKAALLGIQWYLNNGFTKVHLESHSALLFQWLGKGKTHPWSLKMKLQQLSSLCNQCESFRCSHTFREANCLTDSLSKLSHELSTLTNFTSVYAVPSQIRGQILQDYLGTPTFRRKKTTRLLVPQHNASTSASSHGYG